MCSGGVTQASGGQVQAGLPIRERAKGFEESPDIVRGILNEGREKAREAAKETMDEVRQAMGLGYR